MNDGCEGSVHARRGSEGCDQLWSEQVVVSIGRDRDTPHMRGVVDSDSQTGRVARSPHGSRGGYAQYLWLALALREQLENMLLSVDLGYAFVIMMCWCFVSIMLWKSRVVRSLGSYLGKCVGYGVAPKPRGGYGGLRRTRYTV